MKRKHKTAMDLIGRPGEKLDLLLEQERSLEQALESGRGDPLLLKTLLRDLESQIEAECSLQDEY